jgi:hypothetical protein
MLIKTGLLQLSILKKISSYYLLLEQDETYSCLYR